MVLLDKVMEYYAVESDDVVFTPDFVRRRRIGAKLMLSSEHTQLLTIWLNKAAMLLMYYRLTQLTNQRKQVIYTSIFCGCAFVVIEILFFVGWCRPFRDHWAFLPENPECLVFTKHYITSLSLNVFSDVLILMIPLPLLMGRSSDFELRYKWKIKLVIGLIVLLGCYTIGAAITSKIYFLRSLDSYKVMDWSIREAFTASLCANLPRTYPICEYAAKFVYHGSQDLVSRSLGSRLPTSRDGAALTVKETDPVWQSTEDKDIVVSTNIEMVTSIRSAKTRESVNTSSSTGWNRLHDPESEPRGV